MQLQNISSPYSLNKPLRMGSVNPAFGCIEVYCNKRTAQSLGENAAAAVTDYAKAWLKNFPPQYAQVPKFFDGTIKELEIDVFQGGGKTVASVIDRGIPEGQALGTSDEGSLSLSIEEALHTALDAWVKMTFELHKKSTEVLN